MVFRFIFGIAAAIAPAAALAQDANYGNQKAYEYAMRCFTAGGVAIPPKGTDPTGERTKAIRERAQKAFDTAYYMGGKLGYSKSKISQDFDRTQATEMRLMMANPTYFERTKADCTKLGLM